MPKVNLNGKENTIPVKIKERLSKEIFLIRYSNFNVKRKTITESNNQILDAIVNGNNDNGANNNKACGR